MTVEAGASVYEGVPGPLSLYSQIGTVFSRHDAAVPGRPDLVKSAAGALFDVRLARAGGQFLKTRALMQWRSSSRSMAIAGACVMLNLATSGLIGPANAQAMQQVSGPQAADVQAGGFNALDPQWTFANPFMASRFGLGPMATSVSQQAYATKFGSGTVGLFVESNAPNSSNFFGASQQNWFSGLGDPAWRTSMFGSYKSDPKIGLFDGLYTTASFGVTNFKTNPSLPGLANFSGNNDLTAVTVSAGVGLQLTPQISIEGSVGFTQAPGSNFR
jgi:hypothetical protein